MGVMSWTAWRRREEHRLASAVSKARCRQTKKPTRGGRGRADLRAVADTVGAALEAAGRGGGERPAGGKREAGREPSQGGRHGGLDDGLVVEAARTSDPAKRADTRRSPPAQTDGFRSVLLAPIVRLISRWGPIQRHRQRGGRSYTAGEAVGDRGRPSRQEAPVASSSACLTHRARAEL